MNRPHRTCNVCFRGVGLRRAGLWAAAFLAGPFSLICFGQDATSSQTGTGGGYHPEKNTGVTAVNQRPDANRLREMTGKHFQVQRFAAANAERKRQLDEDSATLLKIAAQLTTDLERSGEGEVPLTATVKAEMIEKLAHAVKEKMKLTMAAP